MTNGHSPANRCPLGWRRRRAELAPAYNHTYSRRFGGRTLHRRGFRLFQGKDSRILSLSSREGCLLCLTGRGLIEGIKYITTPMEDGGWSWLVGCRCGWRTSWLPNVQGCESSVSATCRHGMCSLSRKQYDRSR